MPVSALFSDLKKDSSFLRRSRSFDTIKLTGGTPAVGFRINSALLLFSVTGIFMLKFTEHFSNVGYIRKMFLITIDSFY